MQNIYEYPKKDKTKGYYETQLRTSTPIKTKSTSNCTCLFRAVVICRILSGVKYKCTTQHDSSENKGEYLHKPDS